MQGHQSEIFSFSLLGNGTYGVSLRSKDKCPKTVEFPETYNGRRVTVIEKKAMKGMCDEENTAAVNVAIPSGITQIGDFAFYFCTSLVGVTVPGSVTDIGYEAFAYCSSLERVTLERGVTEIGAGAFFDCGKLAHIDIPNSVTVIGKRSFYDCISLEKITFRGTKEEWDKINKSNAFIPERAVVEFAPANEDTITFDDIPDSPIFPDTPTPPEITDKENELLFAFDRLPDGSYSAKLKDKDNCPQSIIFPSSYKGMPVSEVGKSAFCGCISLKEITLPEGIVRIGFNAFSACASLTRVSLPESVVEIDEYAFSACPELKEISLPSGITHIRRGTFIKCYKLENLNIPDGVTHIESEAFSMCKSLKDIALPDSLTFIGDSAFHKCKSLSAITVPESVRKIDGNPFVGVPIRKININGAIYKKQNNCIIAAHKKRVIAGDETSVIPEGIVEIGKRAFLSSSLTNTVIPNGVKQIGAYAFFGCSSLKAINIPGSVIKIEESAFSFCRRIESAVIREGVTHICNCAFSDCPLLFDVSLPQSLTFIGANAFSDCDSVEIRYPGNAKEWHSIEKGRGAIPSSAKVTVRKSEWWE